MKSQQLVTLAVVPALFAVACSSDPVARIRWYDERINGNDGSAEFADITTAQDVVAAGEVTESFSVEFADPPPATALRARFGEGAVVGIGAIGHVTVEVDGVAGAEVVERSDLFVVYLPNQSAVDAAVAAGRIAGELVEGYNLLGRNAAHDECSAAAALSAAPCFDECGADDDACDACAELVIEGTDACGPVDLSTLPLTTEFALTE